MPSLTGSWVARSEQETKGVVMGRITPFEDSGRATQVIIVVLHYGDVQDTWRCLDSLERLRSFSHQVVVVDNGSSPAASSEIARRYPRIHVIRREINGGWAGGAGLPIQDSRLSTRPQRPRVG